MNIPLLKVCLSNKVESNLKQVFESGWIGQGPVVSEFESRLSNFFQNSTVIATNSCTSALQLAFYEIAKTHNCILTTPLTCFATTAAIIHAGLKIKWVDIDPQTLNLDMNDLYTKFEPGDAISVVHYAGRPCELPLELETPIVEDCAHAFGTINAGTHPKTYGCFSFQAVKTLTTGDGGALLPPIDKSMSKMIWYGMDRKMPRNQNITEAGFKYNMNDISAAIGLANFDTALQSLARQRDNAKFYSQELSNISLPFCEKSSYWLYPVMVDFRDDFIQHLNKCGIDSNPVHYRNDKNSCVDQYKVDLQGMDIVEKRMTCIPNGYWVGEKEREKIVEVIKKGW
jgi:dTDP-4-amino-4,6-dideoxy-D-glucose/dTDP-4-amino-2,4-dideoxy-beta-L-xylose transaminase